MTETEHDEELEAIADLELDDDQSEQVSGGKLVDASSPNLTQSSANGDHISNTTVTTK